MTIEDRDNLIECAMRRWAAADQADEIAEGRARNEHLRVAAVFFGLAARPEMKQWCLGRLTRPTIPQDSAEALSN